MNTRLFDILTLLLTKTWGHMLIPVLLGTIFWLGSGYWLGFEFFFWVVWVAAFLVIGWLLTIAAWTRYYWDIYRPED